MKRRIYKKWLKNPFNKRLIWKFCKPFNRVPIAHIDKEYKVRTKYENVMTDKEQPLTTQCGCIECIHYEGFGQCFEHGSNLVEKCVDYRRHDDV